MAWGLPPPGGGGKRGRDTKVSLPLLTPQPFLRTRLPSVARLNARGPQGRLVLQEHTLDGSGAFRSDGANALHRMAAHCYARQITQGKFRAKQPPKTYPTHGTELPYPRLAEHLRCDGSKEGLGESRGGKGTIRCPFPLLPLSVGTDNPRPPKAATVHAHFERKSRLQRRAAVSAERHTVSRR